MNFIRKFVKRIVDFLVPAPVEKDFSHVSRRESEREMVKAACAKFNGRKLSNLREAQCR